MLFWGIIWLISGTLLYWLYAKNKKERENAKAIQVERDRRKVWLAKQKELQEAPPTSTDKSTELERKLASVTNEEIMKKASRNSKGAFNPLMGDVSEKRWKRTIPKKS